MKFFSEYSIDENTSHVEEIPREKLEPLVEWIDVSKMRFKFHPAKRFSDWHSSNMNLFLLILEGDFVLTASDGTKAELQAGDVIIVNDYGKGHTGQVGDKPCVQMHVELPADFPLK